jgi:hypothetical protein
MLLRISMPACLPVAKLFMPPPASAMRIQQAPVRKRGKEVKQWFSEPSPQSWIPGYARYAAAEEA